jgi:radical SAM protein with 4Fe4S-binding SPASM domain
MLSPTTFAPLLKKLPPPLYKVLAQRYIDNDFPRHIFIELTSDCNLSCAYCPRPKISRELPFGLFKKVVDEASLFGPRSFSLHLFGEPLLYSRITQSIRYLKRRGHTVLLTTNGTMLEKFRRNKRKWETLKLVDKIIWSYKPNVKVPEELKTWKNFTVRFFEKKVQGWKRCEVRNYHNYGGSLPFRARFTEKQRYPCYHPLLAPAVNSRGDILICCCDAEGKTKVGNIETMTMEKAWSRMEWVRAQHRNGKYKGICERCDAWKEYPNMFFSWQYITSASFGSST